MVCPVCSTVNPDGANFCHQCGSRLSIVCPACGHGNLLIARFCNQCGVRLVSAGLGAPSATTPSDGQSVVAALPVPAGASEAHARDEERRPVTMLFADLVGFTALADRLDPEQVRELTAITLGRLAREIGVYGGTIDKFIGDAVLALFGAPVAHEDDAERAVGAALAMQLAMGELNETLAVPGGSELALRIGINTGQVVVGTREVGGHSEYTAIGDAVNVAARLQAAAEPGTILVGEGTFRAANRAYAFLPLEPLVLRGKPDPVPAYRVLGPLQLDGRERPASGRGLGAPLVGREAELSSLRYCLDELLRGRGQIAFVVGEPGLGKTRLMAELRREYGRRPLQWAQARALSYGQHLSYGIFNGTVREMFRVEEFADQVEAAAGLRSYLADLDAVQAFPFLAYQLGLPVEQSIQAVLDQLSPQDLQARVVAAIRHWMARLAQRRPLVLVVDDLHWADPSSTSLLDGLLSLADTAPVCFIFLMRPERESGGWQLKERAARDFPHRYSEVALAPLDTAGSRDLLRHLVAVPVALAHLQDQILAKTEGNPLFIEEVVRDLRDRGALARTDEGWEAIQAVEHLHLPDSLQAAIIARIDRLRESVRHVIQTAAVIGRDFAYPILARMLGGHPTLDDDLREAQRIELITELAAHPERQYTFRHALVQEAVYQTLLVRRRKELHAEVAAALEALYPERLDSFYDALAKHYAEAENWPRVFRFASLEGDRAAAAHANREALEHYRLAWWAAQRVEPPIGARELARVLAQQGDVQTFIGLSDEAAESYREALALLGDGRGGDGPLVGRLNVKLARVAMQRQDPPGAEAYLAEAMRLLSDDQVELSTVWSIRSWLEVWSTRYRDAAESAGRALVLARRHDDFRRANEAYGALTQPALAGLPGLRQGRLIREWMAAARERDDQYALFSALAASVAHDLWVLGTADDATLAAAREAVELAERLGAEAGASGARGLLGGCLYLRGSWREAEAELRLDQAGDDFAWAPDELSAYWLGLLYTGLGRPERGRLLLEEALDSLGFPHSRIWLNQALASNRLAAGQAGAAASALERGAEAAERLGCVACSAQFSGVASELWGQLGEPERAGLAILAAREQARLIRRRPTLLAADRAEAALLVERGEREAAVRLLRSGMRLARSIGQPYETARTALQLAEVLLRSGDPTELVRARAPLRTALELFRSLGAVGERDRAEALATELRSTRPVAVAGQTSRRAR